MPATTATTVVLCVSCGKKIPAKSQDKTRCPKCLGVIQGAMQELEADPVAVLGPPDQGHPGSFLWHVRRDRARRAEVMANLSDEQVATIIAWGRYGGSFAEAARVARLDARQRAPSLSLKTNPISRSAS